MIRLTVRNVVSAAAIAMVAGSLAAPAAPAAMAQVTRSCVDTLAGMPEFSRFLNGVVHTHLVQDLRNAREITMFVPTNAAVDRMHPGLRETLLPRDDQGQRSPGSAAQTAIAAHVAQGRHDSRELAQGQQLATYGGTPITSGREGGTIILKGAGNSEARIVAPDIACTNGVIHGIDALLLR